MRTNFQMQVLVLVPVRMWSKMTVAATTFLSSSISRILEFGYYKNDGGGCGGRS